MPPFRVCSSRLLAPISNVHERAPAHRMSPSGFSSIHQSIQQSVVCAPLRGFGGRRTVRTPCLTRLTPFRSSFFGRQPRRTQDTSFERHRSRRGEISWDGRLVKPSVKSLESLIPSPSHHMSKRTSAKQDKTNTLLLLLRNTTALTNGSSKNNCPEPNAEISDFGVFILFLETSSLKYKRGRALLSATKATAAAAKDISSSSSTRLDSESITDTPGTARR